MYANWRKDNLKRKLATTGAKLKILTSSPTQMKITCWPEFYSFQGSWSSDPTASVFS